MTGRRQGFGDHLVNLREQQRGRSAQIATDSQYRKEQNYTTMDRLLCKAEVRKAWRLTVGGGSDTEEPLQQVTEYGKVMVSLNGL